MPNPEKTGVMVSLPRMTPNEVAFKITPKYLRNLASDTEIDVQEQSRIPETIKCN